MRTETLIKQADIVIVRFGLEHRCMLGHVMVVEHSLTHSLTNAFACTHGTTFPMLPCLFRQAMERSVRGP